MAIVLDGTSGITTPALDSVARFATGDMPLGSVLQVVQGARVGSEVNITSTSYVDCGLSASITPTSSTSRILAIASVNASSQAATNAARVYFLTLVRNSTTLMEKASSIYAATGANGLTESSIDGSLVFLDSPATTAAITYKVQGRINVATSTTLRINQDNVGTSTITLMEIAA